MQVDMDRLFPTMDEIPEEHRIKEFKNGLNYLIDGKISKHDKPGMEVFSPIILNKNSVRKPFKIGESPMLGKDEALSALEAAERAYASGMGVWPQMILKERIKHVEKFLEMIRPLEKEFVNLEMWEIAKPYKACCDEFRRTVKYIEDTIDILHSMDTEENTIRNAKNFIAQIRRCPLGVVLCMGPFNYPLNETIAMLIPSLIMGNTVVMKLPKFGALCVVPLMEAFKECFPPGVINIINGDGAEIIPPIMATGKITVLGFIGSAKVANKIINQHPSQNRLRTILGLEAKNPAFIFEDADLDLAVNECIEGSLEFNGQRCTAIKHIWVHENIADKFLEKFNRAVDQQIVGNPWETNVVITPLPEERKTKFLDDLVSDAIAKGARVTNDGGRKIYGNIYSPTVLYPVSKDMTIYGVEQFGPVIPVSTFSKLDDLYVYLQESIYGQQASIFSSSTENVAPLLDILVNNVSRINLNSRCRRGPDELPFTGRKNSAEGTLSIYDALRSFSIRSLVVANEQGRNIFLKTITSGDSKFLKV
jgi:glyceraldehyde-3-phosphate dehydrogenase (NADP+)